MSRNLLRFDRLAALDKTIHEPARLAILSALSACQSASFTYLLALTGLTQGNLQVHLSRLKARGLVEVDKKYTGSYSSTSVHLTTLGKKAIADHWQRLADLKHVAEQLANGEDNPDAPLSVKRRKRSNA